MKDNYLRLSYDILNKIYREKSFSTEALYKMLDGKDNADLINCIVLGTLERNTELDYILSQLVNTNPKPSVAIVIKQGIYCLKYMNGLPDYAVINNSVEVIKSIGKTQLAGFVNAVLKRAAKQDYIFPDGDDNFSLSINYSVPIWIIELLIKDYGKDDAIKILSEKKSPLSHIRINSRLTDKKWIEEFFINEKVFFKPSDEGYFLKINASVKKIFKEGIITYQSLTSIYAAKALDVKDEMSCLDLCSAPGGKAVYIAEKNAHSIVTACDIYPHRIGLIKAYANRMKVNNLNTQIMDATVFNSDFFEKFDRVLVDAPCSALGLIKKQPDILLNRKPEDIKELAEIQLKILNNGAKYLKKGGTLVYSTCTLTKEENSLNRAKFLASNDDFEPSVINGRKVDEIQFLPEGETDGFYIAKFIKRND